MYTLERVINELSKGEIIFYESPKSELGDLTTSAAFKLAKIEKTSPERIAEKIKKDIENSPWISSIQIVKGYVNVFLKRPLFTKNVVDEALREDYGVRDLGKGKTIVIDYSSPNVARPMHVGHLRSTILGGSLHRIYSLLGYRVVGINYLGDVGTQFGKLIYAYKKWVNLKALEKEPIKELFRLYVKFHAEAEKQPELEEAAKEEYRKLEEGEEEHVKLWEKFRTLSIEGFKKVYNLFGINFDEISGESFYIEEAKRLAEELLKKGIAKIGEKGGKKNAVIADLEKWGLNHPVLLKSDGTTLYLSRDLAALVDRCRKYRFHKAIYVVGREQALHFKQLFKIAELMGLPCGNLYHLSFGHLRLPEGKMSTRKGRVIFAEEVLERAVNLAREEIKKRWNEDRPEDALKIGVAAVAYAILKSEPEKDIVFKWEKILSFEGETGPYLQYSLTRAKKILEKAGIEPDELPENFTVNGYEWELVKAIARFPLAVLQAAEKIRPHLLAKYAFSLADIFNKFYEKCPVLRSPPEKQELRLLLVKAFYNTMRKALYLLLIPEPEQM
ncbi:MAG: arginine--tRNA ligase [Thermoprotei archaeon]|nr:MAG: arginine--tRNA ligase [Thermoprotei archaeon]